MQWYQIACLDKNELHNFYAKFETVQKIGEMAF